MKPIEHLICEKQYDIITEALLSSSIGFVAMREETKELVISAIRVAHRLGQYVGQETVTDEVERIITEIKEEK